MFARSLSLLALTAFVSAAAATEAMACCGCAYTCAPPAQIQIWGLSPSYVVNQGPVFSGPGFYTSPTYEGETLTADYPYVGNYPRYDYRYESGVYPNTFRHRVDRRYWQGELSEQPRHFAVFNRHEAGVFYRHGFGPRAITMSGTPRWVAGNHRDLRVRQY